MSPHISYPHLKSNGSCITSNNYYKSKKYFKQNNRMQRFAPRKKPKEKDAVM